MLPTLPGAPDTKALRELPVTSWFQWSVGGVLAALAQHEQGQFYASAILCDYLLRDDRVAATLGTRIKAFLGLSFKIAPGRRAHKGKSRPIIRGLEEDWSQILSRGAMAEAMRWVIMMGFAIGELVWNTEGGRWVPEIRIWHPAHCWYDVAARQYVVNTMDGPVWVTPGDGKWIVFAPHGLFRGWMHGAVRALSLPVLLRQYGTRDMGRVTELVGSGLLKIKLPANALPAEVNKFKSNLTRVGAEGRIFLPQYMREGKEVGFDAEFMGMDLAQGAARLFDVALSRGDVAITLVLLGQNLTTEVQEGSLAAARSHGDVRQDFLEFDAATSKEDIANQVLRGWTAYNFGDPDDAPDAGWNAEPPEDLDTAAKTFQAIAAAVMDLGKVDAAKAIDFRKLFERYNIPCVPEEAAELAPVLAAPAVAPGTTPANDAAPQKPALTPIAKAS